MNRLIQKLYHLPRKLLRPIMPKHNASFMLYIEVRGINMPIGYVSTKGKAVIYGKDGNYSTLWYWGRI